MEILQIRKTLKRKVMEESGPIDRIVEEAYHAANRQSQSSDLIINLPSIHIMKSTLQKQRRKTRPPIPQSIEQLPYPLPDVYCKTTKSELFLLYDGSLKKHVSSPHPNIYIAIDLLQKEQSLASIARVRDDMGAPARKRRKNKVITDECLMKLWQRYDDGRIDIPAFLKVAGMRYFQRPSKS
ncbi:unnamed protein product, partial [Didymodactylos carnosus]